MPSRIESPVEKFQGLREAAHTGVLEVNHLDRPPVHAPSALGILSGRVGDSISIGEVAASFGTLK